MQFGDRRLRVPDEHICAVCVCVWQGLLAEILEPIMGKGLIPADNETWKVRRRAIVPGFHQAWLEHMVR